MGGEAREKVHFSRAPFNDLLSIRRPLIFLIFYPLPTLLS